MQHTPEYEQMRRCISSSWEGRRPRTQQDDCTDFMLSVLFDLHLHLDQARERLGVASFLDISDFDAALQALKDSPDA